jgi:hypothetical protein
MLCKWRSVGRELRGSGLTREEKERKKKKEGRWLGKKKKVRFF